MQDCGVSIPCGLPCSGQNDTVKYPFSESKQSPDTVRSIRFETNGQLRDRHTHVGHPQTTRVCFSGTGSLARLQGPNRRCCWDFFELGLKIIRPPREGSFQNGLFYFPILGHALPGRSFGLSYPADHSSPPSSTAAHLQDDLKSSVM